MRSAHTTPTFVALLATAALLAGTPGVAHARGAGAVPAPESGPAQPSQQPAPSSETLAPAADGADASAQAAPPATGAQPVAGSAPASGAPGAAGELRAVDASAPPAQPGTQWPASEPQPAAAPPPASEPPPPRVQPHAVPRPQISPAERARRKRERAGAAMLGAGFGAFALLYVGSAFYGATVFDGNRGNFLDEPGGGDGFASDDQRRAYGRRMMIPVAGPFAAAAVAPTATQALLTSLAGVAQVATLSMGIAGAVVYGKARKRRPRETLAVSGAPVAGGGVVALSGRF